MIKNALRKIANKLGYDFIKTADFNHGKSNKRNSEDPELDYYVTGAGNYYLPKGNKGDIVANAIKEGKLFDEEIIDIAREYVRPNTSVLDVGANYGQMTVELSRIHPSVKVYSFEAQKMVYRILEKNLEDNKAVNVKAYYNAVYNENDKEFIFPVPDLKRFPSYGSYGIDLKATSGIPIKSITIDSIEFDQPISFMKIDIQGSDLAAMQGAVNTIRKHQMPIIFEYEEQFQEEFGTSFQDYVAFVDSIGYKFLKTVHAINFLIVPKNFTQAR